MAIRSDCRIKFSFDLMLLVTAELLHLCKNRANKIQSDTQAKHCCNKTGTKTMKISQNITCPKKLEQGMHNQCGKEIPAERNSHHSLPPSKSTLPKISLWS